jgi:phage shock protein A
LDFSEHSDDELAKMYESTRKTSSIEEFEQIRQRSRQRRIAASFAEMYGSAQSTASVKELEQARQRSLRGHTDEEFARQRRRARGGPVRPEDANLVAATDDPIAPLSQTTT